MLRQLTSLDAQFLAIEDGRTHSHIAALGIYDPSTAPGGCLTLSAVRDLVASRLHRLPPFRWRLIEVPFGLDHPYWHDDPDFDVGYHIRELALPAPGDERMLAEQVARIVSRPLDRSRPLWELYLIGGLEGGRVAVLTKFHHAAVDGLSGAEILSVLLDPTPSPATAGPVPSRPRGKRSPSELSMLARGVAGLPKQPLRVLKALPKTLPHLDQVPTMRNLPGVGRGVHAPRTRFNQRISAHRRVALTNQSLADVKRIKNHFGVTVNDVVVAICAGALHTWLDERGDLPEGPLLGMVPVSVRTDAQVGTFGNRLTTMLVSIPTHEPDPETRLLAARDALRSAKERHKSVPATVLQDANHMIPAALFAQAARVTTALTARHPSQAPFNTVVSNVAGWSTPQYLAGARLEALYPVSSIMHDVGLNLTVMSYCGRLDFGIVADRDLVDDAWPLADALGTSHDELLALVD